MPFWSSKKSVDPVCGMQVEEKKAAATHDYEGVRYYFCSASCKSSFQKAPQKYIKGVPPTGKAEGAAHDPGHGGTHGHH